MARYRAMCSLWVLTLVLVGARSASAWHLSGCVYCDVNGNGVIDDEDEPVVGAVVTATAASDGDEFSGTTNSNGCYRINLPDDEDSYSAALDPSSAPADAVTVIPPGGAYDFNLTSRSQSLEDADFLFDSATCRDEEPGLCWMTGGGVKFEPAVREWLATCASGNGPRDSVGGVVYPSCSAFPSNGGQWNHVSHALKLHLIGTDMTVVRCGNVEGIPPGTESPVCAVNFIEFVGTGRVQGVGGNRIDPFAVSFFGRVEDHNEPGNEQSARSGEDIDTYFLRVVDEDDNLVFLIDSDHVDDGAVDPMTISGGNFQIHCTSCDDDADGGGASLDIARPTIFLRGDSNTDGRVDVTDAVHVLNYLFLAGDPPLCPDASDANDDGVLDLVDGTTTLSGLFAGGPAIPAPFPEPWIDPTSDLLEECALGAR